MHYVLWKLHQSALPPPPHIISGRFDYTEYKCRSSFDLIIGFENGENQANEKRPNTDWILFQRDFRTQRASSFFNCSIPCGKIRSSWFLCNQSFTTNFTVSSFHMADNCVPSIIIVNTAKSKASKVRKSNKITVAGGENVEQIFHSCLMHWANWFTVKNIAWIEIIAM